MSEAKISDAVLTILIAQAAVLGLKIGGIGGAANLSWTTVFMPIWIPVALLAVVLLFYVLNRALFPEKKRNVTYTSTRWQETLTETHRNR